MKKVYIPTLQERRVNKLLTEKYGNNIFERISKLEEEFQELIMAQYESDEALNDELSDTLIVLVHIAQIRNLTIEQLIDMALDKITKRETNPNYKR